MPAEAFPLGISEPTPRNRRRWRRWLWLLVLGACRPRPDLPERPGHGCFRASRLESAAKRYFEMSARGDVAALKQNSIASVAASFAGIEAAVKENQAAFTGAKATVRPPFLLTADGAEPLARAEFLCGVFGPSGQTKDSAVFVLNNLPPGKYGVTILDVNGDQAAMTLTFGPASRWAPTGNWQDFTRNPRRRPGTTPHGSSSAPAISRRKRRITAPGCITARRSPCPPQWTS